MTTEQRKQVNSMHNKGYSYAQIAEYFNVSRNTIREIIKRHEERYVWHRKE